ncbi:MAG TPA: hypothetical protein VK914_09265 [bacterium]|jgi:hypothetical protein|nr:hypothetical protein [bacterium]
MEKTVREMCLICKGERWIPDPLDSGRSLPCPYCEAQGWVVVAPANFVENPEPPGPAEK